MLIEMADSVRYGGELRTPKNVLIGKIKDQGRERFLEIKRGNTVESISMHEFIKNCISLWLGRDVKGFSATF